MEQGRGGLWDLLFGVHDPTAANKDDIVKTENDALPSQLEFPDEFLALLADPATQSVLSNIAMNPDYGQSDSATLTEINENCGEDALDMDVVGELSQYLQLPPELTSSSSGSGSDEDTHSIASSSMHDSPMSVHSDSSSECAVGRQQQQQKGREELKLSKEELSLLAKEGITLPKFLPLTKQEERTLKRIRRKIRNKKSAQESRRKKKVYVDQLEDQVKDMANQNKTLCKRVKDLEKENSSLQQQLKTLQSVLSRSTRTTKATGTCLMALVLSVALIVTPYGKNVKDQEKEMKNIVVGSFEPENVTPVRSRLLYSLDGPPDIKHYHGIPLANPGYKSFATPAIISNDAAEKNIQLEQWDVGLARAGIENLTIEIPQQRKVENIVM